MNRYLLFAGEDYYPGGGWADFRGSFSRLSDAVKEAKKFLDSHSWADTEEHKYSCIWWHVINAQSEKCVRRELLTPFANEIMMDVYADYNLDD